MTLHLNGLLALRAWRARSISIPERRPNRSPPTRDTSVVLLLEEGRESARFWTTDLTAEYVRLNADYHT